MLKSTKIQFIQIQNCIFVKVQMYISILQLRILQNLTLMGSVHAFNANADCANLQGTISLRLIWQSSKNRQMNTCFYDDVWMVEMGIQYTGIACMSID